MGEAILTHLSQSSGSSNVEFRRLNSINNGGSTITVTFTKSHSFVFGMMQPNKRNMQGDGWEDGFTPCGIVEFSPGARQIRVGYMHISSSNTMSYKYVNISFSTDGKTITFGGWNGQDAVMTFIGL